MLSENLQRARKIRGLSQAELAAELNVVRQTISKWEKGISAPDCELLLKLSEVLDVPLSTLLGEGTVREDMEQGLAAQLEQLRRRLNGEAKRRQRQKHRFAVVLLLCGGTILGWGAVRLLSLWQIQHRLAAAASEGTILGGADAATSIYTAAPANDIGTAVLGVILIAVALWMLIQTHRKVEE